MFPIFLNKSKPTCISYSKFVMNPLVIELANHLGRYNKRIRINCMKISNVYFSPHFYNCCINFLCRIFIENTQALKFLLSTFKVIFGKHLNEFTIDTYNAYIHA